MNTPVKPLKTYAIDQRVRVDSINHNGHEVRQDFWKEVCQLQATRCSNAARVAERKWKGGLRVRLIQAATNPNA